MKSLTPQQPGWRTLNPFSGLLVIRRYRGLLNQLVRRNIEARYKGTVMGLMWMGLTPLVMLAVYTFVFSVVFKARWAGDFGDSKTAFALIMFCGMVVFNIFAESVTSSVEVITGNPNYVKKVVFPLEVLPVASVMSAGFFGMVWLAILLAGVGFFMHKFCLVVLCLPLIFVPLFLLCCGVAWFVASLGVYVRDLKHVVGILIQILFFMTPVFYSLEMVPDCMRPVLLLNPLTPIIQSARNILIYNKWPDWLALGAVTAWSLALFQLGYFWFVKTKRGFADVL